jgi:hypothetical protein
MTNEIETVEKRIDRAKDYIRDGVSVKPAMKSGLPSGAWYDRDTNKYTLEIAFTQSEQSTGIYVQCGKDSFGLFLLEIDSSHDPQKIIDKIKLMTSEKELIIRQTKHEKIFLWFRMDSLIIESRNICKGIRILGEKEYVNVGIPLVNGQVYEKLGAISELDDYVKLAYQK